VLLRISLLFFIAFNVNAQQVKLALTTIPHVLEHDVSDAPYNKLVSEILAKTKHNIYTEFMPSARANLLLNQQKLDCIFPIIPTQTRSIKTKQSVPINGIRAYVFNINNEPFTKLSQLNNKIVVYLRGYMFGDLIAENKTIKFFPVSSQNAALGMLKKNRAEAYIDYIPDLKFALSPTEFSSLNYDENAPVIVTDDVMECRSTAEVLMFLEELNQIIETLRQSGRLKKILGRYYVPIL
jgi:ABC-type amino acid transport substrate-binding protein